MTSNLPNLIAEKANAEGRSLTPRAVSRESGVTWRKIYPMMRGEPFSVTDDDIAKLCAYLRCTPGELFVIEDTS